MGQLGRRIGRRTSPRAERTAAGQPLSTGSPAALCDELGAGRGDGEGGVCVPAAGSPYSAAETGTKRKTVILHVKMNVKS